MEVVYRQHFSRPVTYLMRARSQPIRWASRHSKCSERAFITDPSSSNSWACLIIHFFAFSFQISWTSASFPFQILLPRQMCGCDMSNRFYRGGCWRREDGRYAFTFQYLGQSRICEMIRGVKRNNWRGFRRAVMLTHIICLPGYQCWPRNCSLSHDYLCRYENNKQLRTVDCCHSVRQFLGNPSPMATI